MKASHVAIGLVVTFLSGWTLTVWRAHGEERELGTKSLTETLEVIRTKHQVPALTAAACIDGKIVQIAAAGVRKIGAPDQVTIQDNWHIGSCTKSMTASLAAILVEEGRLKWETKVNEVLKDVPKLNDGWRDVTLEQLLQHRAGAPEKPPAALWQAAWKQVGTPTQQRRDFVFGLLKTAPEAKPGTRYRYSNQGYSIAGAMLERVTGIGWEDLMRERLFKPLGMQSAGFGVPDPKNHPLGHGGKRPPLQPIQGIEADNPPAIGPGGTVYCSISDFARYAAWHADAGRSGKTLLKPESFARLHQPVGSENYAMGWSVVNRPWAGGTALTHTGSNTLWFAVMWVAPEKKAAFVAATNAASDSAFSACDDAIALLIDQTSHSNQNQ